MTSLRTNRRGCAAQTPTHSALRSAALHPRMPHGSCAPTHTHAQRHCAHACTKSQSLANSPQNFLKLRTPPITSETSYYNLRNFLKLPNPSYTLRLPVARLPARAFPSPARTGLRELGQLSRQEGSVCIRIAPVEHSPAGGARPRNAQRPIPNPPLRRFGAALPVAPTVKHQTGALEHA
jgi:hypothetical protein